MTGTQLPGYLRSELEGLRQAAFSLVDEAEAIVKEQERAAKQQAMKLAELIKGPVVRRNMETVYDPLIRKYAKDEFQIRMMRAIVFEEQVHEWPPFIEGRLEDIGFGDSIGPSQIRASKWAEKYRTNRRDILNPKTHFQTMRKLLDDVERKANENGMKRTPENVGSLWNNMSARAPTDYGRRVKEFDAMLEKEKTAAQQAQQFAAAQVEAERQQALLREREKREAEQREAERKKQEEQRKKDANYGAGQRSHLPSEDHRDSGRPSFNKDRFDNILTRPKPAYPQPWPPESWKKGGGAGGGGAQPEPLPSPLPPPTPPESSPPPEPPSKENLPVQGGGPIRLP